jgi:hypothetical protein
MIKQNNFLLNKIKSCYYAGLFFDHISIFLRTMQRYLPAPTSFFLLFFLLQLVSGISQKINRKVLVERSAGSIGGYAHNGTG